MNLDRPAEITSLLEKLENVYLDTLPAFEYGNPNVPEIMLRAVLQELLISGVSSSEKLEKVLQCLRPLSELVGQ